MVVVGRIDITASFQVHRQATRVSSACQLAQLGARAHLVPQQLATSRHEVVGNGRVPFAQGVSQRGVLPSIEAVDLRAAVKQVLHQSLVALRSSDVQSCALVICVQYGGVRQAGIATESKQCGCRAVGGAGAR